MPRLMVYLRTYDLTAKRAQLYERLRLEQGMPRPNVSLLPHITIKRKMDMPHRDFCDLPIGLERRIRRAGYGTIKATVLEPAVLPITNTDDVMLHLPVIGEEVTSFIDMVLDFFQNDLGYARGRHEGTDANIMLLSRVAPKDRESFLSIARSFAWPSTITFDALIISRQLEDKKGGWQPYKHIPFKQT